MTTWRRVLECAVLEGDDPEVVLKKKLQTAMALASLPAVFTWGALFLPIGRIDLACMSFGYCAATVAMLIVLAVTKRWELVRGPHTLLVLAGPAGLHFYAGGFAASGGAILWSFIAPVAAMMFGSRMRYSIALLVALLVVGGVREMTTAPGLHALTREQAAFFFMFNATGLACFVYFSTRHFVGRLADERERSEKLLLNVLPAPIAERLKRTHEIIADRYESVTVAFSDLVGFTALSARLPAKEVVDLLNEIFTLFDALAEKHGVEKIKTIGDAYMVVGGLPEPCADHASRVAKMALDMNAAVETLARARSIDLAMRIGVHSGEVVAGVIGRKKFSYDLWGDTVNAASRMESHGQPGRVQISSATRELLGRGFECEPRGAIDVRGKGRMETFWLSRADESAKSSPSSARPTMR
jgi:guanylate cyclase